MGYCDYLISQLNFFLLDYQRDAFGVGAPTDAVLEVSGSPPEDFESIVRRYVAASPFAERRLGATLRAGYHLMKALVTPAPRLEEIAARLELPRISHAMLATESASWRRLHALSSAGSATEASA